jgi:hypothetical protein
VNGQEAERARGICKAVLCHEFTIYPRNKERSQ